MKAASGAGVVSSSRSISWAITSVSVSEVKVRPSACSSPFSAAKFSMMPLCTTATRPARWGWALRSAGAPWVAQRVWPTPVSPPRGEASSIASKLRSLPFSRRELRRPPSRVATPALS